MAGRQARPDQDIDPDDDARETAFRSGATTSRIAQLTVVDCLFVTLAQQDLPRTRVALERTFAAAQAKRVRRPRRQPPGD